MQSYKASWRADPGSGGLFLHSRVYTHIDTWSRVRYSRHSHDTARPHTDQVHLNDIHRCYRWDLTFTDNKSNDVDIGHKPYQPRPYRDMRDYIGHRKYVTKVMKDRVVSDACYLWEKIQIPTYGKNCFWKFNKTICGSWTVQNSATLVGDGRRSSFCVVSGVYNEITQLNATPSRVVCL